MGETETLTVLLLQTWAHNERNKLEGGNEDLCELLDKAATELLASKEREREWQKVTVKKTPAECAKGIGALYNNWQKALERERVALEELEKAADTFRDFATADRALMKPLKAAASEIAENHIRATLAALAERKGEL